MTINSIQNYFFSQETKFYQTWPYASVALGALEVGYGSYLLYQACDFTILKQRAWQMIRDKKAKTSSNYFLINDLKDRFQSIIFKDLQKIKQAVALIFTGLALIGVGIWGFSEGQPSVVISQEPLRLDLQEERVKSLYGAEALKFDPKDPRPKLLYLVSKEARSNKNIFLDEENFNTLNKTHDIRYKMIDHSDQICTEITEGSKTGDLKTLVLQAHGNPEVMNFSNHYLTHDGGKLWVIDSHSQKEKHQINETCFKGLSPDAEISLFSCKTGADASSIAATIARVTKRTVWAPNKSALNFPYTAFSSTVPARATFFMLKSKEIGVHKILTPFINFILMRVVLNMIGSSNKIKLLATGMLGITALFQTASFLNITNTTCQFSPDGYRICHPPEDISISTKISKFITVFNE